MPSSPNKLSRFWQELKRRNVFRVVTVYAGAAFVILELVYIIAEPLMLPSWLIPVVIILLSIGLFKKCLELDSTQLHVYSYLFQFYHYLGEIDQALKYGKAWEHITGFKDSRRKPNIRPSMKESGNG